MRILFPWLKPCDKHNLWVEYQSKIKSHWTITTGYQFRFDWLRARTWAYACPHMPLHSLGPRPGYRIDYPELARHEQVSITHEK